MVEYFRLSGYCKIVNFSRNFSPHRRSFSDLSMSWPGSLLIPLSLVASFVNAEKIVAQIPVT